MITRNNINKSNNNNCKEKEKVNNVNSKWY